jgi:hypothetical protein
MKDIQFQQLNKQLEFIVRNLAGHELKFDNIDKTLIQINARFEHVDKRFDTVVEKLLNHDQRLFWIEDNMATKDDIKGLIGIIDHWGKSIQDIKVDHTFSAQWLTRMQDQLGWHEQDIRKMKLMLNLA